LWAAVAALPWLVAACASMVSKTVYQEYQGSEGMMIGKGGTVRHVSGVDVWQIGEPNREYRIIGVIQDTTLNNQGAAPGTLNILNVASMVALSQREKRIAIEAKKRGGDAVVYISGNREFQSQTLYETTHSENQLFAVVKYGQNSKSRWDASHLEELKGAIERGNGDAIFNLGVAFNDSAATGEEKETVKVFVKAAQQGLPEAQCITGMLYSGGKGVPQDESAAAMWMKKSAEQGCLPAQLSLTLLYALGQGVPKDEPEAAKWCRRAADQGDPKAQGVLGAAFAEGEGVPQDSIEAYKWFCLAAAPGGKLDVKAREAIIKGRDDLALKMSSDQISEGKRRASAFVSHKEARGNSVQKPVP